MTTNEIASPSSGKQLKLSWEKKAEAVEVEEREKWGRKANCILPSLG